MVAGYTSDEVQAKIDLFLLNRVEVARTQSGSRDVIAAHGQVFDLLSTSLLLRPDSFFYVVWLGKNRIQALVQEQINAVDTILTAYTGVNRAVKKVESTTDLTNAEASLASLSAGLNAAASSRGSIGPAVDRFRRNIERFITTELQKNVLVSGTATPTPDELRATITSVWAAAAARHVTIGAANANLVTATRQLDSVSLPERAVRGIVERIRDRLSVLKADMSGSAAVAKSRDAMLELFVMRTLLTKSSSFQTPRLDLMPRTGDATTLVLSGGSGVGSITGTVSGPFNYAASTTLSFQTAGPTTTTVTLPGSSAAELRSAVLDPVSPISFVPSGHLRLSINFGAETVYSFSASPYATPSVLATAINAAIVGAGATCSFDGTTNQLVIRTTSTSDSAALSIGAPQTINEQQFRDVLGFTSYARATPVEVDSVVAAINAGSAKPIAAALKTDYGVYTGELPSVGSYVEVVKHRGAGLVVSGTTLTATTRFDGLGVKVGDALRIAALGYAGVITGVAGNVLTVGVAPGPPGTYSYTIGPDLRGIPAGARARVVSYRDRDNTGFYRVTSGDLARLNLDRDPPGAADAEVTVTVSTHFIRVSAPDATALEGITAFPSTTGAGVLGFVVTSTQQRGTAGTAVLNGSGDFLARGVRIGDLLNLVGTGVVELTGVEVDTVTFSPEVAYPLANPSYTIQSARYFAYNTLSSAVSAYAASRPNVDDIDAAVRRILRGAKYLPANSIESALTSYLDDLLALNAALTAYVVPYEATIDSILRMLQEQGFDRAYDVLLDLDIDQFFAMSPEASSYGTYLSRVAADTARQVTPETKYAKSQVIVQEVQPLSFQRVLTQDQDD